MRVPVNFHACVKFFGGTPDADHYAKSPFFLTTIPPQGTARPSHLVILLSGCDADGAQGGVGNPVRYVRIQPGDAVRG